MRRLPHGACVTLVIIVIITDPSITPGAPNDVFLLDVSYLYAFLPEDYQFVSK